MMTRPHGRAFIDSTNPKRTALCQRCGTVYNLEDLYPQYRWAGLNLQDTGFKVCYYCLDMPNPQERALILKADPPPEFGSLPNSFPMDMGEITYTADSTLITADSTEVTCDSAGY